MTIRSTNRAISIAVAAAFIAAAAAPASADPTTDKPKQEEQAPVIQKKRETQYCVIDKITGSLLPHKVCKTRQQWIDQTGQDPVKK